MERIIILLKAFDVISPSEKKEKYIIFLKAKPQSYTNVLKKSCELKS